MPGGRLRQRRGGTRERPAGNESRKERLSSVDKLNTLGALLQSCCLLIVVFN